MRSPLAYRLAGLLVASDIRTTQGIRDVLEIEPGHLIRHWNLPPIATLRGDCSFAEAVRRFA
jgi:hypothetical protein